MRSELDVNRVFDLHETGWAAQAIARDIGMSVSQVRRWLKIGRDGVLASPMRRGARCSTNDDCRLVDAAPNPEYAYLLGQYLGDGSIVAVGRSERLSIATSDRYPAIIEETVRAIQRVMPGHAVSITKRPGWRAVSCYSVHWPCLFPQHGPGRKHLRPIVLDSWQEKLAFDDRPDQLVRGLLHSDGCRVVNRVRKPHRSYEYVRYFFDNRSDDIHEVFATACDRIGVKTRRSKPTTTSVARRASVEILERLVGPKR